jgi:heme A synthase
MRTLKRYRKHIVLAFLAGVVFAGAFTHITYPCSALPGESGCVSYEKAVMHLNDLVANVQGSLVHFLLNILLGFVIVLAIFLALSKLRKNTHLETRT